MISDTMPTRSVFLEFTHPEIGFLEGLRYRFDPLAGKIPAHVHRRLSVQQRRRGRRTSIRCWSS